MSMKNSNDTIGNRSRDLTVCSTLPQPLRHRVPLRRLVLLCFPVFNVIRLPRFTAVYVMFFVSVTR
jgi:hypothetical protein